jgi:vancomycin permeability regulator SanA
MMSILKKIFLIFSLLFLLLIILIPLRWLFNDNIPKWSIGIIYGNKVELDWTPSNRLKARLDAWIYLFNNWFIEKIIVSWWIWIEWFDEAEIMKTYLVNKWINSDIIIVDNNWYTTRKTWINAKKMFSTTDDIVWISQYYHISRVKLSLIQEGFIDVYWYSPSFFETRDIYSIIREVPAYLKYLFN